jgi:hypothetical protein
MGPHPIVVPRIDLLCRLYLWREMMVARPWERNAARLSSRFWLSKIDTISHSWLDSVTDCFPCGRMCFGLVFVNLAECYEMKRASFSLVCADNRRQRPAQTQPKYRRGRCRVCWARPLRKACSCYLAIASFYMETRHLTTLHSPTRVLETG